MDRQNVSQNIANNQSGQVNADQQQQQLLVQAANQVNKELNTKELPATVPNMSHVPPNQPIVSTPGNHKNAN